MRRDGSAKRARRLAGLATIVLAALAAATVLTVPAAAQSYRVTVQLADGSTQSVVVELPEGTNVTLEFKSSWDMEWDYDYGFVLTGTSDTNLVSQPSLEGFSTSKTFDPNSSSSYTEPM